MPSKAHLTRSHSNSKSHAKNGASARRDFSSLVARARVVTIRCIYMRWFFLRHYAGSLLLCFPIPRSHLLYRSSLLIFLFALEGNRGVQTHLVSFRFSLLYEKNAFFFASSSSVVFTSSSLSPLPLLSLRCWSPNVVVSFVSPVPSAAKRPILQRPARVRATDISPTPNAPIVSPTCLERGRGTAPRSPEARSSPRGTRPSFFFFFLRLLLLLSLSSSLSSLSSLSSSSSSSKSSQSFF